MYLFGGWNYGSILAMVDTLVYNRRYGGFFDIINNFTVKELLEVFNVIQNKENEEILESALSENSNGVELPTNELSKEMIDFLMDN